MVRFTILASVLFAAFLAGCVRPIDPLSYAASQEVIVGSQAAYKESIVRCAKFLNEGSAEARQFLQLSGASPQVTCERYMKARRDGRISYDIYLSRVRGEQPEEFVRILQGH